MQKLNRVIVLLGCILFLASSCARFNNPKILNKRTKLQPKNELISFMIGLDGIAGLEDIDNNPINGYRIVVENPSNSQCDYFGAIDEVKFWYRGKIVRSISPECLWILKLQLGTLSEDGKSLKDIYFETGSSNVKLTSETFSKKEMIKVNLSLNISDLGWDIGYGDQILDMIKKGTINSNGEDRDTKIDIGVLIDPIKPNYDDSIEVYKTNFKKGVINPVLLAHKSHGIEISYDNKEKRSSDFLDLWLAKELNSIFSMLVTEKFKVKKISHLGIYNYRNIAGTNKLSRHSFGLAIDISSFTLEDGSVLSVKKDWNDPEKGKALKKLRDFFCMRFDVVLSPDYNAAHHDHFHIDLDPGKRFREPTSPKWADLENTPVDFALVALSLSDQVSNIADMELPNDHEILGSSCR